MVYKILSKLLTGAVPLEPILITLIATIQKKHLGVLGVNQMEYQAEVPLVAHRGTA